MKQLITPIAIIVALIASLSSPAAQKVSRHDDVQCVQAENQSSNNFYLSDIQYVRKARGGVIEAKAEDRYEPAGTKSVVETKLESTLAEEIAQPAAVPVVTAEEAEKLNEFAIFLSTVKTTVVEGEITERSELPDPEKSDYPNCRFTVHFTGNSIKSGEPCPKELSLIVEGFENYHNLPNNDIKTGDKVICSIIPFAKLPQDFQSTQQADDLELFLLEDYYVVESKTINSFFDKDPLFPKSGIFFSDEKTEYRSIFERAINPPIPEDIKEAQRDSINKDLEKMTDLLDGYDKEKIDIFNIQFSKVWKNEMAKDAAGYNRVGNIVWRNIDNSFWALPINYTFLTKPSSISKKTMDCFLSLKSACEANGVQLIISLVPDKYVISSRVINKEFRDIPDLQTATFVKQFSEAGIEAIYASDKIIQKYNKYPFAFFFPSDDHPGDTTQDCLSELLIERLRRYNIPQELDSTLFYTKMDNSLTYRYPKPFLFPQNCDIGSNSEGNCYSCLHIYYDNERVAKDKNASIMIVGNSFMVTPMPSSPEALPSFLMYKSLLKVDAQYMNGYGPFSEQLTRLLFSPETYLKNKRVLIMQFGTNHLINVSSKEAMLDITQIDNELCLLNNKK